MERQLGEVKLSNMSRRDMSGVGGEAKERM